MAWSVLSCALFALAFVSALAPALSTTPCLVSVCGNKFGSCPNGSVANIDNCNCYCGQSVPCPACDTTSPTQLTEPDHDVGRTFTLNYFDPGHAGCLESDMLHRRDSTNANPITASAPIMSGTCYVDPSNGPHDKSSPSSPRDWLNAGQTFVAVPSYFIVFLHVDRAYLYASCTDGTCANCRTAMIVSDGQCLDTSVFNNDPHQRIAGVRLNFGKTVLPAWQIVVITVSVIIAVFIIAIGAYFIVRARRLDAAEPGQANTALLPPWKFGAKGSASINQSPSSTPSTPAKGNGGILDGDE